MLSTETWILLSGIVGAGCLVGLFFTHDKDRAVHAARFGMRWTVVGIYVALTQEYMNVISSSWKFVVALLLPISAIGIVEYAMVSKDNVPARERW